MHASLTLPYTTATSFLKYKAGEDNSSQTSNLDAQPQPSEITALHALIPLRASVDPSWKTISLPLTVFGKQLTVLLLSLVHNWLLVNRIYINNVKQE